MAKTDRIKSIILEAHDLSHVGKLFEELGFPVSREDDVLTIELDSGSFLEAYVFQDRAEVNRLASKHVYQRAGQLAISSDFEDWIFIRRGLEDRIRLQRYRVRRSDLREKDNPIAMQRLAGLKYNQIQSFEALFERKDISNRFYREFNKKKLALINHITGIADPEEKRLFAQVLLDRLIFLYFLQEKEILDGNKRYFNEKFRQYSKKKTDFYEVFLRPLFFDALCKKERSAALEGIVGKSIPYLNGGLFLQHEVEERNPKVSVHNDAFCEILSFFESWNWNTNERADSDEDSIDPYILGYIFENTLGDNKSGGVYYTPPSISEFLTDETVESHLYSRAQHIGVSGNYRSVIDFIDRASESELTIFYEMLRSLRILDPACGSGQFLVQALHALSAYHKRLVDRVLRDDWTSLHRHIQDKGDYHLTKEPIYGIRRFVTANNLYGCDLLAEAAEITKLRLFLAMVEGIELSSDVIEPLPNIDFHIRTGDSLTGFLHFEHTPSTGGKKQKKAEKQTAASGSIQNLLDFGDVHSVMGQKSRLIFQYTNEHDPEKAISLRTEIRSLEDRLNRLLNDRLDKEMSAWGIRPKQKIDFIDLKKDMKALSAVKAFRLKADDLRPFHWGMEFSWIFYPDAGPESGALPGFDIVLMNPPWDVVQPSSQEFFVQYFPEFRNLDKNEATRKVEAIIKKDSSAKDKWIRYNLEISAYSSFLRGSRFFSQAVDGKINLYKVFLERAWKLLKVDGSLGVVIPAGLYSDLGSKDLRHMLFEHGRVNFLYSFENAKALFENVHRSFKFILLSASRAEGQAGISVPAAFMLHTEQDLRSAHARLPESRFLDLPLSLIRQLSPESMSLMEFKSAKDIEIVKKMARFPRLGEELKGAWNVKLSSEFNMTTDAHLFVTKDELEKKGAKYDSDTLIWKKGKEEWWPLYEGKCLHQHNSFFAPFRYWIPSGKAQLKQYSLGYRDIARDTDVRTLIASILPAESAAGHSLPRGIIEEGVREMLFALCIWNSFIADFFIRISNSGAHVIFSVLYALPVPRFPVASGASTREKKGLSDDEAIYRKYEQKLIENAARLIGTTAAFDDLLQEVFGKKATHKSHGETDPVRRQKLKNEIDAMAAHIYGLTEDELRHVLSTFPLVEESVKQGVINEYRNLERGVKGL